MMRYTACVRWHRAPPRWPLPLRRLKASALSCWPRLLASAISVRAAPGSMLASMPEIVAGYRGQIQRALKLLTDDKLVHDAREATRRLLAEGRITLSPKPDRTA